MVLPPLLRRAGAVLDEPPSRYDLEVEKGRSGAVVGYHDADTVQRNLGEDLHRYGHGVVLPVSVLDGMLLLSLSSQAPNPR